MLAKKNLEILIISSFSEEQQTGYTPVPLASSAWAPKVYKNVTISTNQTNECLTNCFADGEVCDAAILIGFTCYLASLITQSNFVTSTDTAIAHVRLSQCLHGWHCNWLQIESLFLQELLLFYSVAVMLEAPRSSALLWQSLEQIRLVRSIRFPFQTRLILFHQPWSLWMVTSS